MYSIIIFLLDNVDENCIVEFSKSTLKYPLALLPPPTPYSWEYSKYDGFNSSSLDAVSFATVDINDF